MTLGSGIFVSTLLLVLVFALWQATKHRKWKTIGKAAAVLIAAAIVIAMASWGWYVYANRPQVQRELEGIALGATQLDVQLMKGKPTRELTTEAGSKDVRWIFFDNPEREDEYTFVLFREDESTHALNVSIVCRHAVYLSLLGFGSYTKEPAIVAKLGEPTNTSIRADGLAKTISFNQWKTSFEFEKGSMTGVCISDSGKVRYSDEHTDNSGENRELSK